jgi:hypothetical protein
MGKPTNDSTSIMGKPVESFNKKGLNNPDNYFSAAYLEDVSNPSVFF